MNEAVVSRENQWRHIMRENKIGGYQYVND